MYSLVKKRLDYSIEDAEIVQLSNDAYYNLAFSEPCLDEENMDEVEEIKARFPYGFKFGPSHEFVDDSDLVECQIIPICENTSSPFTHYCVDGKYFKHEFYYSEDKKRVHYRIYNMHAGKFRDYGWCDVNINQYGKPDIRPNKCIFPLWGKFWARY